MRLIWWLLQLAIFALALPGRNQRNNQPRAQPKTPLPSTSHVQIKTSAPTPKRAKVCMKKPQTIGPIGPVAPSRTRIPTLTPLRTSTSKSAKACKSKPPHNVPSRTKISKSTPTPTTTISVHSLGCYGLPVRPNPGPVCVCTNGLTTRLTVASECPTTIPADWTTPAPQPTKSTSQIPYSYYNMTNGALIHCASSVVTKLDIYTGLIETYCAGSTSTDSNTPGVTETTSLWPATESPVTYGNWGYYTGVTEGLSTYNSTLAAYNLAGSFYTAFSSLCTNTGTPIITTTTTTSWNTFATLPGGATGTMSTMAQEATYYKCDGEKTMSVAPWWIDSNGGIDESGTLAVSIIDSLYSIENLDTWLWTLAFRYAHATVSSATNQTIWSSSNNGGSETSESSEFPVFRVPTQVQLIYGDSLNSGVGLERLTGKAVFEMSAEEELACEIAEEIAMAFEMLLAFAAGPEAEAVGIAISDGVREAVQDGIDTSRFFLGCPSDED